MTHKHPNLQKHVISVEMMGGDRKAAIKQLHEAARARDWAAHANIEAVDERVLWTEEEDGTLNLWYHHKIGEPGPMAGGDR